jgi:hypothetical protein
MKEIIGKEYLILNAGIMMHFNGIFGHGRRVKFSTLNPVNIT